MPWVHKIHEVSIKRQGLLSWTVALALFTASVALRFLFDPILEGMKFLTFWPAIALATLICGRRQGTFVLVLSALTGWYYFMEPFNSFAIKDKTTMGALAIVDAAESLAQKRPSGLEKEAMKTVRGAARAAVRRTGGVAARRGEAGFAGAAYPTAHALRQSRSKI